MKKQILLLILSFVTIGYSFCQDNDTIIGKVVSINNPCTTEPCLPGAVTALQTDSLAYILTTNHNWNIDSINVDGRYIKMDDSIRVIGIIYKNVDLKDRLYYEIEIEEVSFLYISTTKNNETSNTQNFLGIYTLTEVCTSKLFPGYSDTLDHEIEIIESSVDTFDIQFCLALLQDTIRAVVLNDSTFQISLQTFPNFDSTSVGISGEGSVNGDSLKIYYFAGGSFGAFECYCEGIRKKDTGIKGVKEINSNYFLYPNPVKEILNINLKPFDDLKQDVSISIYGLKGNLVLRKNTYHSSIDVSELTPGTYILSISNGKIINYSGSFIKE